jgi:NADP-dependent 3-hydroxy acid dehydrogenase YdfG
METRRLAFITGASAGIGEATAIRFAAEGYNLLLNARRKERLEKLAANLVKKYGIEVRLAVFDIRNRQQVESTLAALGPGWSVPDVLVNNAGLASGLAPINEGSTDDWDQMIDTNVKGLLYVTRALLPAMVARKAGHIVNIGSIAAKETYPNGNVYCATKFAVDALSKSMRIDLLKHDIKVTAIHPGAVETEFSIVRFKGDTDRAKKVYEGFENLVAEDIAEAIWFAVSRPAHVNINELTIMPTAQAQAGLIHRRS